MPEKSFLMVLTLLASYLLFLATPRFFSAIEALYSDTVIEKISKGETPSKAVYLKTQEHLVSAIEWVDYSLYWRQFSYLKFVDFTANVTSIIDIDHSIADLKATTEIALSLMPVAPYSWYDMAQINAMYPETIDSALFSLKVSVYADRYNRNLIKPRVLFLWNNLNTLDAELQDIFKSQSLLLWQLKRREIMHVINENPEIIPWIFEALSGYPEELLILNEYVSRIK